MAFEAGKTRGVIIGFALVLAVCLFLVFRNHGAVETVEAVQVVPAGQVGQSSGSMPDTIAIGKKVNRIRHAVAGDRDPFGAPPKAKPHPKSKSASKGGNSSKPAKPRPKKLKPPTKRAILYDTINPSAKLTLKGRVSEWLQVGDSFQGWTVTEITSSTVTVSRDGKTFLLD